MQKCNEENETQKTHHQMFFFLFKLEYNKEWIIIKQLQKKEKKEKDKVSSYGTDRMNWEQNLWNNS